ncbi:CMRF35-like molecule 7 [Salminus brasiliensis]|uniref:CMRF35-like molecule 7 n=1 Tax=Salminus brasiliensis TaxID=930266 RepID=UPI003B832EC6
MDITAVALTFVAGLQCVMSAGVKAPLGGNASICCPYHRGSESYPKYFSKGRPGERFEIVRANRLRTWSTDDRFSLKDDQEKKEFTVTIRNLSVEDAGLYWCGVDRWGPDNPTEVNLDVVQDILPSSKAQSPRMPMKPHCPHQGIRTSRLLLQIN